ECNAFKMSLSLLRICSIFAILIGISQVSQTDEEFEGRSSFPVEHAFGSDAEFTERGTITIQSMKANVATFNQLAPLTKDEKAKLKALVKSDGNYRIRIPVKTSNSNVQYVSSFMKACSMYESKLSDQIIISVGSSGGIVGISMVTYLSHCAGITVPESSLKNFNTTVDIRTSLAGPMPDTQSYIQKMEQEKAAKEKEGPADNRSFIAKYWMYIVPVFIFMMVASNAEQPSGGGK
ncbi:unnamed protein product, partial [Owenia fusiformis]